jgi:hypothetical protein
MLSTSFQILSKGQQLLNKPIDNTVSVSLVSDKKYIRIMSFYKFSPIFIMYGGNSMLAKLHSKYEIEHQYSSFDFFMNIFTLLFCDELIILAWLILCGSLMSLIWIPNAQKISYDIGYADYKSFKEGFHIACGDSNYKECFSCNQEVNVIDNKYSIDPTNGCRSKSVIICSQIQNTTIDLVRNASNLGKRDFTDYTLYEDTYLSYGLFGTFHSGSWIIISCNKKIQGEKQKANDIINSILSVVIVMVLIIVVFVIINYGVSKKYKNSQLNKYTQLLIEDA